LIAGLIAQAAQAGVPQELLQQAVSEILEGKDTPTVDQILQAIEQFLAQQDQMAQQQAQQPQPGMEGQPPMGPEGLPPEAMMGGQPGTDMGDQILDLAGAEEGGEGGDIGDEVINLS
jgi:hypothetical protein